MVGFRILVEALKAGYRVRATARSQSKVDAILATPSIKSIAPGNNLSFAIVPDMLADGAFDAALKGITYVIHAASPIPKSDLADSDDLEADMVRPAVGGTTNMLVAASKTPTVKRVIITSSMVALCTPEDIFAPKYDKHFTANDVVPEVKPPYSNLQVAYSASKINALSATREFMKNKKPSFDVINIQPTYVIGRNELATDPFGVLNGSNYVGFGHVLGKSPDTPVIGGAVHLEDVAKIHVLALDPKVRGNQNFGANVKVVWNDANEIVKKHFPDAVKDGRLPANGNQPTKELNFIVEETEQVLGLKFQSFETQIVELAEQYLEVLAKSSTNGDKESSKVEDKLLN